MSRCVFDKMSEVQSSTSSRVPILGAHKDTEIAAQYLMWSKTIKAWASANKCRDALTSRESDLPKTAAEVAAAMYQWLNGRLTITINWVDDYLFIGTDEDLKIKTEEFKNEWDCDDVGRIEDCKEYIGMRIDYEAERGIVKITQPVQIQGLRDEYPTRTIKNPATPAIAGRVLIKDGEPMTPQQQKEHRSITGKLLHLRASRPEIQNPVRECSTHMNGGTVQGLEQAHRIKEFVIATPQRGLKIQPNRRWNGRDREFEFEIRGRSDSDYAKNPENRKSVGGHVVYLEGAPVSYKSGTHKIVELSVTEAEQSEAVNCAQTMMYIKRLLESMGLKVKLPMILEVDNKATVDLANNLNTGGRTRHVEVKQYYLRELKELKVLEVRWIAGSENETDMFTKNLHRPDIDRHGENFSTDEEFG